MANGGTVGPNLQPSIPVAAADATRVVTPVRASLPTEQAKPEQAAPPQQTDKTNVAATGSAQTQVNLSDDVQSAPPPLQPAADEPDLPSPANYSFHQPQVTALFQKVHGSRVLSAKAGEQLASGVLQQLGIDPGDQGAVKRLQRKIGAYPDGKFGPQTFALAVAYLQNRASQGDAAADEAKVLLFTPVRRGGGGHQPTRPTQPTQPTQPTTPTEPTQPTQPEAPAEMTESQVRAALDEPANAAMNKALDDAGWSKRDDVAESALNNPAAVFVMQPKTVARHVTELINGWTTDGEKEAMMKGLRTMAATGNLGATLSNLDIGDLTDELSSAQVTELKALAQNPDSGVTAEQLKKLGS